MSRLIQTIVAILFSIGVALPTAAQEVTPESLNAARELMTLSRTDKFLDQSISTMLPQVAQLLEKANPEKGAVVRSMMEEFVLPEMRRSIPEAVEDIAAIYARNFTRDELNEVIAFYKTPVGQKFLDRMPSIMTDLTAIGQAWGQRTAIKALRDLTPKFKEQGIDVPI
jgi:uncharacterized protein